MKEVIIMAKSFGYHTFSMFAALSYEEANKLRNDFEQYRDSTGRIRIFPEGKPRKYIKPDGSECEVYPLHRIKYKTDIIKDPGISWIIWICSYSTKFLYYGIEAKINPKILSGVSDYTSASDSSHLAQAETNYNAIVSQISPDIPTFDLYSIKRIDYCYNADLVKMKFPCNLEQMMALIKHGDIPRYYEERKTYNVISHRMKADDDLYLESKSLTFNCYRKGFQLEDKDPEDYAMIEQAMNVIRLELQCHRRKTHLMKKRNSVLVWLSEQ
jgi:hypothetical protein